jgi:ABC-type branched-subunit amino acid transport system ATPase component
MLQQLLLVIPLMGFILLVLGNFTVSNNTIGSASTTNSISIGSGSTTAICTMRGIYNTATGAISLTGNTIQNCSVYGTGASVLYGIYRWFWNSGH